MNSLTLSTIAEWSGGELLAGDPQAQVDSVCIDSRQIVPHQLFVAIRGERFDGHDFLAQVEEAGAAAVLIERSKLDAAKGLTRAGIIVVEDSLLGIQRLAKAYRASLPIRIVGITGSNGKTSTKDLLTAILGTAGNVFSTRGNLNNHLGVPLTLLSLDSSHQFGVVEMGMNHFGEIAPLVDMAKPQAGIITNIGVAHIEHMESRAGIAQEKGVLLEHLDSSSFAVIPAEDDFAQDLASRTSAKVIFAGIDAGQVQARDLRATLNGTHFVLDFGEGDAVDVELPILGRHMVQNATLAAAVAQSFGISSDSIAEALKSIVLTHGRLQMKEVEGVLFVDDSYNANPDSMKAALKTLAELDRPGRKIAVLGRMGELGVHAEDNHREIGQVADQLHLDALFSVGHEHAALISDTLKKQGSLVETAHFSSHEEAAAYLKKWLKKGDTVLLKGSRSTAMEKVFNAYITP